METAIFIFVVVGTAYAIGMGYQNHKRINQIERDLTESKNHEGTV